MAHIRHVSSLENLLTPYHIWRFQSPEYGMEDGKNHNVVQEIVPDSKLYQQVCKMLGADHLPAAVPGKPVNDGYAESAGSKQSF